MKLGPISMLNELPQAGGTTTSSIVPFYSDDTLIREHTLVKALPDGLEVYVHQSRSFATIGTRGIRANGDTSGLIIHASIVKASSEKAPPGSRYALLRSCTNLAHTPVPEETLLRLLNQTLDEAGIELVDKTST